MKTPEISILVPAYNVDMYISECLDSLVAQTFRNIEIIVLDDGSTDNTGRIIDNYSEEYDIIRGYHQENKGIVRTRSELIKLATGNYIGWVDADDFVEPEMFEKMYENAITNDAEVVICNYSFFPQGNWRKGKWYKPFSGKKDWYFIDRNVQHWNKIVKSELINNLDIIKWNDYCGEGSYALVLLMANRIVTMDEELYSYRLGHQSLSNNLHKTSWYILNTQKSIRFREAIHCFGLDDEWGEYYDFCISFAYIQAMIISAFNSEREVYLRMREENRKYKMYENYYSKIVMDSQFGKIKSFVMRWVIPFNYTAASLISKYALKRT